MKEESANHSTGLYAKENETKKLKYPADWILRKKNKKKISVITCYDYSFAKLLSETPVDSLLVGDSMGMVIQGQTSTLPVTLEEIIYHTKLVKRGSPKHFVIADMPFGSYQISKEEALKNSFKTMKESGSDALKFEGTDEETLHIIKKLTASGIPVMGHIGLTPQSVLTTGGYRIQGKTEEDQTRMIEQASALEKAGCFSIVLELTVATVAREITERIHIPTIGIGAGIHTDGQVLVLHDMLGLNEGFHPKFVKHYASLAGEIKKAAHSYHQDVSDETFPGTEHSF